MLTKFVRSEVKIEGDMSTSETDQYRDGAWIILAFYSDSWGAHMVEPEKVENKPQNLRKRQIN